MAAARNDDAPVVRGVRPEKPTENSPNFKPFADLRAKLALAGFALLELSDGTFLITRWNLSKPCVDLHAVASFLRHVSGAQ